MLRNYYSVLNKYKLYPGKASNNQDFLFTTEKAQGLDLDVNNNTSSEKNLRLRSPMQSMTNTIASALPGFRKKPQSRVLASIPMYKLRLLYKSFAIYNNINSVPYNIGNRVKQAFTEETVQQFHGLNLSIVYSSKILRNTHKLLSNSRAVITSNKKKNGAFLQSHIDTANLGLNVQNLDTNALKNDNVQSVKLLKTTDLKKNLSKN
ncbi:MAG: hypothetical protein EOP34_02785 [Rickettsiales bacterium]|nr:MAG: hypothetical protein EOP34_02785 [Rickettsiales bacterium]